MDNLKIINLPIEINFQQRYNLPYKVGEKMEEILNNLIAIDETCKRQLQELQEKQDNIEYLVNEEISKQKDEIKNKYKFKIDRKKMNMKPN